MKCFAEGADIAAAGISSINILNYRLIRWDFIHLYGYIAGCDNTGLVLTASDGERSVLYSFNQDLLLLNCVKNRLNFTNPLKIKISSFSCCPLKGKRLQ